MSLISFRAWLDIQESSPLTRWRSDAARGLKPPQADWMSRSTPHPWEDEQHRKKFKPAKKKKKDEDDKEDDDKPRKKKRKNSDD